MKLSNFRLIAFAALILGAVFSNPYDARAQGSYSPYANSSEGSSYCQMWRTGWSYRTSYSAYNTTLGTQKDTTSGATALTVSTATYGKYNSVLLSNTDTFTLFPVNGLGSMKFTAAAYKSTGTDTLTAVLQESSDGLIWTNVTQVTASQTLRPTSGSVPVTCEWLLPIKYDLFYQIIFTGQAGNATRVQAWFRKIGAWKQ